VVDVFLANEQHLPVDEMRLSALARHALASENFTDDIELSVLLVTSSHIKELNGRFAGNDYETDVLAFPMMDDAESPAMLGDVVICPEVAEKNAALLGHDLAQELDALLVHGTLHLIGYDHQGEADKARMNDRMRRVLGSFDPASR
jgi:probable rRNA maturation factor